MADLTMFDAVDVSQIPADAPAVAGYVNGRFITVPALRQRFPHAHILTIAVTADADADCLDIESGDATPGQAAAWYLRQKARGATRPCLYASAFQMDTEVIPAISAAGIRPTEIRLWSAHFSGHPHRCSPSTCRELGRTADGTQFTDRALGRNLDQSLLAPDFFGTVPAPSWTETMIANLPVLAQGDADQPGRIQYVHRIQALVKVIGDINKLHLASLVRPNGTFGQSTRAGLIQVQGFFGLAEDGIVGPKTWAALVAGQR